VNNRIIRKILSLSLISVCLSNLVNSQDAAYSQFYSAPLLLNPAFAGGSSSPSFSTMYRNQWPTIDQSYQTFSVSYDQYFTQANSGIGISIFHDRAGAGALSTNRVDGIYSYRAKLGNNRYIKGAISASFSQRRLDWDRFIFYDALHPLYGSFDPSGTKLPTAELPPTQNNTNFLSIGTGFLFVNPKFYFGFSMDHLNRPNSSFYKKVAGKQEVGRPIKYSLHGGYQIDILEKIKEFDPYFFITPSIMFLDHGGFRQLNGSLYAESNSLIAGGGFRYSNTNYDALIGFLGIRYNQMKIIYSFDYNVGSVGFKGAGSHEIGINVTLGTWPPKFDIDDCLQIFK
jgi:type IX secretion system PorP/SprF family membrane protein